MAQLFLEDFDADQLKAIEGEHNSRTVKRRLISKGYTHQLSFYGSVYQKSIDRESRRRYEILSKNPWKEREIRLVKAVIKEIMPPDPYSIWIYDSKKDAIKEVAKYGDRTY